MIRCGAGPEVAADAVIEDRPDLASKHSRRRIARLATLILCSEIPQVSKRLQKVFGEFNRKYFAQRLREYQVRVVFDLHIVADEPVYGAHVSTGLIRFEERCIYIRYTDPEIMVLTLVHETAHAATNGGHGKLWLDEMARLEAAGAPVPEWELA